MHMCLSSSFPVSSLLLLLHHHLLLPHLSIILATITANRKHTCDLLLDQNYEDSSRYSSLINEDCELLLGPKYVLLNPKLLKYKKYLQKKFFKRVLIYFGASDSKNLTARALDVLSMTQFKDLCVDIVYGIHYQFLNDLKSKASARGCAVLHGPQPHLGELMERADLAIGAGGVSNWERLCIGLPSIVIAVAQNQVPISKILGEIGLIKYLGEGDKVSEFDIFTALEKLRSENYLATSQKSCQNLCDGLGISRVVNRMMMLNNSIG